MTILSRSRNPIVHVMHLQRWKLSSIMRPMATRWNELLTLTTTNHKLSRNDIKQTTRSLHCGGTRRFSGYYQPSVPPAPLIWKIDRNQIRLYGINNSSSAYRCMSTTTRRNNNGALAHNVSNRNQPKWNADDNDLTTTATTTLLPRHPINRNVNFVLEKTETMIRNLRNDDTSFPLLESSPQHQNGSSRHSINYDDTWQNKRIFANSYVDLGRIDTVGFDFDYTLVTYKNQFSELIYDMALKRLVVDKHYPNEMLLQNSNMRFDSNFFIRGLAIDNENGWICHLTHNHKVATAWEGKTKLHRAHIEREYSNLSPQQVKKRFKPMNEMFSMVNCCLVADTIQFFRDSRQAFSPEDVVADVLSVIYDTHMSGDFHRLVAKSPERYFEAKPYLKSVLMSLKDSGKRLIFVSNSPFWYIDAGMNYVIGSNWRDCWDVIIVSAGKPRFYTETSRPFREVVLSEETSTTGEQKFVQMNRPTERIEELQPNKIYAGGCLHELTKCINWNNYTSTTTTATQNDNNNNNNYSSLTNSNVLYIGDSLFVDLVDAKEEFGWMTCCVTPELSHEMQIQQHSNFRLAQQTIQILLKSLRQIQTIMGNTIRSKHDLEVLDQIETLISNYRDSQCRLHESPYGSIFRARFQPSLYAHSLHKYCDLYMSSVGCLVGYSPQHRFYPEDVRLFSHELMELEEMEEDEMKEEEKRRDRLRYEVMMLENGLDGEDSVEEEMEECC